MPNFSTRADLSEWMDTEDCGFEEFRACLRDLERVNALTFTYRPTIAFFERLEKTGLLPKDRPLVVVDVGSGYGGMLRRVGRWAEQRRIPVSLTGVDLNPWSAAAAAEATPPGQTIAWVTARPVRVPAGRRHRCRHVFAIHPSSRRSVAGAVPAMDGGTPPESAGSSAICTGIRCPIIFSSSGRAWQDGIRWSSMTVRSRSNGLFEPPIGGGCSPPRKSTRRAADISWRVPFRLCVERIRA